MPLVVTIIVLYRTEILVLFEYMYSIDGAILIKAWNVPTQPDQPGRYGGHVSCIWCGV